jgi:transposase
MKQQIKNILTNWSFNEGLNLLEKFGKNRSVISWISRKGEEKATEKLKYELEKLLDSPEYLKKIAVEIVASEDLSKVQKEVEQNETLLSDEDFVNDEYFRELVQKQNSAYNQEMKIRNENYLYVNDAKGGEQHAQTVLAQREKRINLSLQIDIYKSTGKMTNDDLSTATQSYSVGKAQTELTNKLRPKLSRRRKSLKAAKTETKKQDLETEILILEAQEIELKKIIEEGE